MTSALDKYISDMRSSLQIILLKELPSFLQQRFSFDEYELELALREYLNGNVIAKADPTQTMSATPCTKIEKSQNCVCPYPVNGEKCGTKIRGNFKYCSKHRSKKDSKSFDAAENVVIRNDIIKSWIIAQSEFTVKSPNEMIVDGMITGTGKNIKKIALTPAGIKKALELGLKIKK